jgi:hypothetical protein
MPNSLKFGGFPVRESGGRGKTGGIDVVLSIEDTAGPFGVEAR